jgi:hypothetical protein
MRPWQSVFRFRQTERSRAFISPPHEPPRWSGSSVWRLGSEGHTQCQVEVAPCNTVHGRPLQPVTAWRDAIHGGVSNVCHVVCRASQSQWFGAICAVRFCQAVLTSHRSYNLPVPYMSGYRKEVQCGPRRLTVGRLSGSCSLLCITRFARDQRGMYGTGLCVVADLVGFRALRPALAVRLSYARYRYT